MYIQYTAVSSTTLQIDLASEIPAVRQIVNNLRVLLVDQKLAAGITLPSVRRLGMELGVHFNTVAEAYRELADEGWLELQHGRGAVVKRRSTPAKKSDKLEEFRTRLRSLVAQMRALGVPVDDIATELRKMALEVGR